jgi:hypothetical protein
MLYFIINRGSYRVAGVSETFIEAKRKAKAISKRTGYNYYVTEKVATVSYS